MQSSPEDGRVRPQGAVTLYNSSYVRVNEDGPVAARLMHGHLSALRSVQLLIALVIHRNYWRVRVRVSPAGTHVSVDNMHRPFRQQLTVSCKIFTAPMIRFDCVRLGCVRSYTYLSVLNIFFAYLFRPGV